MGDRYVRSVPVDRNEKAPRFYHSPARRAQMASWAKADCPLFSLRLLVERVFGECDFLSKFAGQVVDTACNGSSGYELPVRQNACIRPNPVASEE